MAEAVDDSRSIQEAFALGWEVSRLHLSGGSRVAHAPSGTSHPSLPGLSDLSKHRRTQIGIDSVDARLVRIGAVFTGSRIRPPSTEPLHQAFDAGVAEPAFREAVRELHLELLRALTVAESRLGKAYTLGRALHETHHTRDAADLTSSFRFHRVLGLCRSLEDLKGWFPAHSSRAVAGSLRRWRDWIESKPPALANAGPDAPQRVRDALLRQGDLWYGLLTGEQRGTDLLRSTDYVDAATELARQSQQLLGRLVRGYALTLAVMVTIIVAAVVSAALTDGVPQVAAALVAVAGALGITWKGVGASIAHLAGALREPLWTRQLDFAVEAAIEQVSRLDRAAP